MDGGGGVWRCCRTGVRWLDEMFEGKGRECRDLVCRQKKDFTKFDSVNNTIDIASCSSCVGRTRPNPIELLGIIGFDKPNQKNRLIRI